jgi:pyrimidine operon attenuation protein/uracil phosphoribosyltransferase
VTERTLMTEMDMRRAIVRIAHEIIEKSASSDNLVLVGIQTRGVPLARRLSYAIAELDGGQVPIHPLDIGFYRDDRRTSPTPRRLASGGLPVPVEGRRVVVVDDVLFTGRSIRSALDAVMDLGRPERIEVAVLIDRGHRELPIRPDFVGKNVPTSRNEGVKVRLREIDGRDEVVVVSGRRPEGALPAGSGDPAIIGTG